MDSYFPKTRRPTAGLLTNKLKRPPPSITPPNAAKIPKTPQTPKDARLSRPNKPPPVKQKSQHSIGTSGSSIASSTPTTSGPRRPIAIRELFKSAHSVRPKPSSPTKSASASSSSSTTTPIKSNAPLALPISRQQVQSGNLASKPNIDSSLEEDRLASPPTASRELFKETTSHPLQTSLLNEPISPSKIISGPLKGVSTSLLDLIRAKEAAARNRDPHLEKRRKLLGIAPEIVRIVPTVFTTSKKEIMPYDVVVDKCFKGLKSNYTSSTICDCLELLDKVAPEWISTVKISRGRFMRINRDKYTIPQLLESVSRYKAKNC